MRWFSHRRSPSPPGRHAMVSSVAACCIRPSYGARPTIWGWLSSFSFFCPWWPWPLTFDLDLRTWARFLYTRGMYLTAKFDRPAFSRSEVIMRTNWQTDKQTDAAENIHLASLRYAGG